MKRNVDVVAAVAPKPYTFEDDPQLLNIRLNIGMTGYGKTTLLSYQLDRIQALNKRLVRDRIILVDPSNDKFHFEGFGRICETAEEVQQLLGPKTLQKYHLRVRTLSIEVFDYLCWEAYRQEDVFLIVDEVANFIPTKAGSRMKPESFNRLAIESRHVRARILATAQRPSQIHNNLLNLAQETNIFRTRDLRLVREQLETPENLKAVRRLKKLTFFNCKDGKPELCVVPKN